MIHYKPEEENNNRTSIRVAEQASTMRKCQRSEGREGRRSQSQNRGTVASNRGRCHTQSHRRREEIAHRSSRLKHRHIEVTAVAGGDCIESFPSHRVAQGSSTVAQRGERWSPSLKGKEVVAVEVAKGEIAAMRRRGRNK